MSARQGVDELSFEDYKGHIQQIDLWLAAVLRSGILLPKTQIDYDEQYALTSPGNYRAVFKIGHNKIIDVSWDGAILSFKPRPEMTLAYTAFVRWVRALNRVAEDIASIETEAF